MKALYLLAATLIASPLMAKPAPFSMNAVIPLAVSKTQSHQVLLVDQNGRYVILKDQSRWEVRSGHDRQIAGAWLAPTQVVLKKSNDPVWPYMMTNINTRSTIYVRYLPAPTGPELNNMDTNENQSQSWNKTPQKSYAPTQQPHRKTN
ncbi:MAG: hypothetical protein S4CHLAM102_07790 [Chlamydiia bacterium]|nr:hypothetical protein [Chlamydiia bacterium]